MDRVRACLKLGCSHYLPMVKGGRLRLPQDGGQAGKAQGFDMTRDFRDWNPHIVTITGNKATRANGLQEAVNLGNFVLVEEDVPELFAPYVKDRRWQRWHHDIREEFRLFREDLSHASDDQVDACADGQNELAAKREWVIR